MAALTVAAILLAMAAAAGQALAHDETAVKMKIGVLPVADTILLIAAVDRGFFNAQGLDVELVPFQSALDKDAAAIAGSLDGHYCEIISAIVQQASGRDFKVAATTSATSPERRMFGLVTSPQSAALSLEGLEGKTLLVARQTITDFLAGEFFERKGLPVGYMTRQDVRKIPVRMQLLMSGKANAALIPEPLLSIAEQAGGKVVMDDRELKPMPLAVVALEGSFPPDVFIAFREALAMSVAWVNSDPEGAKELMSANGLIPPQVAGTYRLPVFNPALIPEGLPDPALYQEYVVYLQGLGVLAGGPRSNGTGLPVPHYSDVVRRRGR
jgi:NitT/TauT family transport system substrate-binding protein